MSGIRSATHMSGIRDTLAARGPYEATLDKTQQAPSELVEHRDRERQ